MAEVDNTGSLPSPYNTVLEEVTFDYVANNDVMEISTELNNNFDLDEFTATFVARGSNDGFDSAIVQSTQEIGSTNETLIFEIGGQTLRNHDEIRVYVDGNRYGHITSYGNRVSVQLINFTDGSEWFNAELINTGNIGVIGQLSCLINSSEFGTFIFSGDFLNPDPLPPGDTFTFSLNIPGNFGEDFGAGDEILIMDEFGVVINTFTVPEPDSGGSTGGLTFLSGGIDTDTLVEGQTVEASVTVRNDTGTEDSFGVAFKYDGTTLDSRQFLLSAGETLKIIEEANFDDVAQTSSDDQVTVVADAVTNEMTLGTLTLDSSGGTLPGELQIRDVGVRNLTEETGDQNQVTVGEGQEAQVFATVYNGTSQTYNGGVMWDLNGTQVGPSTGSLSSGEQNTFTWRFPYSDLEPLFQDGQIQVEGTALDQNFSVGTFNEAGTSGPGSGTGAEIRIDSIDINATNPSPGEQAVVEVAATNSGENGSQTFDVSVNGSVVQTLTIEMDGQSSGTFTVSLTVPNASQMDVVIGSKSDTVSVNTSDDGGGTPDDGSGDKGLRNVALAAAGAIGLGFLLSRDDDGENQ